MKILIWNAAAVLLPLTILFSSSEARPLPKVLIEKSSARETVVSTSAATPSLSLGGAGLSRGSDKKTSSPSPAGPNSGGSGSGVVNSPSKSNPWSDYMPVPECPAGTKFTGFPETLPPNTQKNFSDAKNFMTSGPRSYLSEKDDDAYKVWSMSVTGNVGQPPGYSGQPGPSLALWLTGEPSNAFPKAGANSTIWRIMVLTAWAQDLHQALVSGKRTSGINWAALLRASAGANQAFDEGTFGKLWFDQFRVVPLVGGSNGWGLKPDVDFMSMAATGGNAVVNENLKYQARWKFCK